MSARLNNETKLSGPLVAVHVSSNPLTPEVCAGCGQPLAISEALCNGMLQKPKCLCGAVFCCVACQSASLTAFHIIECLAVSPVPTFTSTLCVVTCEAKDFCERTSLNWPHAKLALRMISLAVSEHMRTISCFADICDALFGKFAIKATLTSAKWEVLAKQYLHNSVFTPICAVPPLAEDPTATPELLWHIQKIALTNAWLFSSVATRGPTPKLTLSFDSSREPSADIHPSSTLLGIFPGRQLPPYTNQPLDPISGPMPKEVSEANKQEIASLLAELEQLKRQGYAHQRCRASNTQLEPSGAVGPVISHHTPHFHHFDALKAENPRTMGHSNDFESSQEIHPDSSDVDQYTMLWRHLGDSAQETVSWTLHKVNTQDESTDFDANLEVEPAISEPTCCISPLQHRSRASSLAYSLSTLSDSTRFTVNDTQDAAIQVDLSAFKPYKGRSFVSKPVPEYLSPERSPTRIKPPGIGVGQPLPFTRDKKDGSPRKDSSPQKDLSPRSYAMATMRKLSLNKLNTTALNNYRQGPRSAPSSARVKGKAFQDMPAIRTTSASDRISARSNPLPFAMSVPPVPQTFNPVPNKGTAGPTGPKLNVQSRARASSFTAMANRSFTSKLDPAAGRSLAKPTPMHGWPAGPFLSAEGAFPQPVVSKLSTRPTSARAAPPSTQATTGTTTGGVFAKGYKRSYSQPLSSKVEIRAPSGLKPNAAH